MEILKNLSYRLFKLLKNIYSWKYFALAFIFLISILFFYPLFLKHQYPLPLDALVGAHTPWIEIKWPGYEAGVPIKNQEITDAISQFYPWRSLVGEYWRNFKFPLWNNYMISGIPFLATLHSAGFYPLNFVYLLFSDIASWSILLYLQIFLSGLFMYLFLKDLRLSKIPSLVGSLSFMFSGYMIAWLEFATGGQAGLWLPLLLLFVHRFAKTEKTRWVVYSIFIFFMIFSAGDFQVPLYIVATFILFVLYLFLTVNRSFKFLISSFLTLLGGFLISSLQLLPTLQLFTDSQRFNDPYIKEYFYGLMDWQKITNFIWPDFFGNVVTRNYWARFGFHEYLSYIGIIPLLLSIYSLITKKIKYEIFFTAMVFISVLFLFPTPLGFLPYKLKIPALSTSSASRIIYLVDFSLAVLASYGLDKLSKNNIKKFVKITIWYLVATGGIALGIFVSLRIMQSGALPADLLISNLKVSLKNMLPQTIFVIGFLAFYFLLKLLKVRQLFTYKILLITILTITSFDLLRFAWKNTPFSESRFLFPETKILEFLRADTESYRIIGPGIPMNYFMEYRIESANGYETIYPINNAKWFSLVNFGNFSGIARRYGEITNYCSPLISYDNIKYVVDYKKDPKDQSLSDSGEYAACLIKNGFDIVSTEGRVSVFQNPRYLPKVWRADKVEFVQDENSLIAKLNRLKWGEKTVLISGNGKEVSYLPDDSFKVSDYLENFNKIKFSVEASESSYIFISESFNKDWKATIDGRKTNLLRANYLFSALEIGSGKHQIVLNYEPMLFQIGLKVSIITTLFLFIYLLYDKNFRRRTP